MSRNLAKESDEQDMDEEMDEDVEENDWAKDNNWRDDVEFHATPHHRFGRLVVVILPLKTFVASLTCLSNPVCKKPPHSLSSFFFTWPLYFVISH